MLGIVDSSSRSYALKAPTVAQVEIRLHVNGISEKKRKNMLAITARRSKRLRQAMETQDSARISTLTSLPDAGIT